MAAAGPAAGQAAVVPPLLACLRRFTVPIALAAIVCTGIIIPVVLLIAVIPDDAVVAASASALGVSVTAVVMLLLPLLCGTRAMTSPSESSTAVSKVASEAARPAGDHSFYKGSFLAKHSLPAEPDRTPSNSSLSLVSPLDRLQHQLRILYETVLQAEQRDEAHVDMLRSMLEDVEGLSRRGEAQALFELDMEWLHDGEALAEDDPTRAYLQDIVTGGQSSWEPRPELRQKINQWMKRARRNSHDGLGGGGAATNPTGPKPLGIADISFMQTRRASVTGKQPSLQEQAAFRTMQQLEEPGSGMILGGATWSPLPVLFKDAMPRLVELESRLLRRTVLALAAGATSATAGESVAGGMPLGRGVDDWAFDVVVLDELSGGHCLALLVPAVFRIHELYDMGLDEDRLHLFLHELERRYGKNPYHNRMHGGDVLLGVHRFLLEFGFARGLSRVHTLAALFAAVVHDFCHPGTSNAFEVKSFTPDALRYSDASVLEHRHLENAFTTLHAPGFNFLHGLSRDDYCEFRRTVIAMVLHTDLKGHFEFIARLKPLPDRALSLEPVAATGGEGLASNAPATPPR